MGEYSISEIRPNDVRGRRKMDLLLEKEGIMRDGNLDYSIGIFDEDYQLVATGSCFKNTLRCMAVSSEHQGEGLLNQVVTALMEHQQSVGCYELFLYTKCDSAKFFQDLGFYEIARVDGRVVFMENRKTGFEHYLDDLSKTKKVAGRAASIVMNANPFTLGHQFLVELASRENDVVHLFVVSEDVSLVPFNVRYRLVKEGTKHLSNIIYHESGSYMISNATFPSYFLKDSDLVISSHAELDAHVFARIANALAINRRYFGDEPFSHVTAIYNEVMERELPKVDIECVIVPRLKIDDEVISASMVRQAIREDRLAGLRGHLPDCTFDYFNSDEASDVIAAIKGSLNVIHY